MNKSHVGAMQSPFLGKRNQQRFSRRPFEVKVNERSVRQRQLQGMPAATLRSKSSTKK